MIDHMSLATKNAFAALADAKKGKKGSSKSSKDKKDKKQKAVSTDELEKAIFSQPSINITSWADEDDDDYSVPVLPSNWEEQVSASPRSPPLVHAGVVNWYRHIVATEPVSVAVLQAGQGANGVADEEHDHDEHSEEVRKVGVVMLNRFK